MIFRRTVVSACLLELASLFVSAETVADSDKYFSLHAQREYGVKRLSKRWTTLDEDIDFMEVGFFLDLEIGSHKDPVKVLLDTGSSDLWVASKHVCSSKHDDNDSESTYDCEEYGSFNAKKSKTFRSNHTEFFLSYGDTTCAKGVFGRDTVIIGNTTVKDVNLAVASFTNSSSGVLGIGYEATESTYFEVDTQYSYEYVNFPEKLVAD